MPERSSKFELLVRIGYCSRAVLYITLGLIAIGAVGQISQGTEGIFQTVERIPGGTVLLWILVLGLASYALFRFASPLFDIEHNGSDFRGWAQRVGHAGSGVGHLALAWTAYTFASGSPANDGGSGATDAAAGVLSVGLGSVVIGVLGIGFGLAALAQAEKAITAKFMQRISPQAPDQTLWLGRAGYATRAVIFAVIGWSLIETGFYSEGAGNVKTLGEAVASLANTGWVFTAIAIGLVLFGLFSFVLARYRVIPELDADRRIPKLRVT